MTSDIEIEEIQKPTLLYDGDCGICSRFAGWASFINNKNVVDLRDFNQFPEAQKQALRLNSAAFQQGMYFLLPIGSPQGAQPIVVLHGAWALNAFLSHFRLFRLKIWLLSTSPIFLWLEMGLYTWVARNRAKLSQALGLTACTLKK